MKKNVLFIMNNLTCGGAEKALISLLETIDYSVYNVDLFLFKHEGLFFNKIPKQVNLLQEPEGYKFFDMPIKTAIMDCIYKGRLQIALSRIWAGYIFRTEKNINVCGQRVWKFLSKSLSEIQPKYDIAVGYLEKNPIYFCVDKVKAKKKIGFIHTDYDKMGFSSELDLKYFGKLDYIVTVSEECVNILKHRFPMFSDKIKLLHNIISPAVVRKMSLEATGIKQQGIKIASVGRLHHLKGFDMAIESCEMLVKHGYDVKWYVVGDGEERPNLTQMIEEKNLQRRFVLLGVKENPYPYIKEADVYVQTSRFEGKSIALDEAKILQKPIVVTNYSTAKDQIKNNENGLIVDMNPTSIFMGIKRLIDDNDLRTRLVTNLSNEDLGTETEIQKLYLLFA